MISFLNFYSKKRKDLELRSSLLVKIKKPMSALEKSLKWLVLKCPGDNKPDCPIIDELAKG